MLPEGWRHCRLEDIAKVSSGGTPERMRSEYWGGDIPWVTTGEIGNGPVTSTLEKITEQGLRNSAAKIFCISFGFINRCGVHTSFSENRREHHTVANLVCCRSGGL